MPSFFTYPKLHISLIYMVGRKERTREAFGEEPVHKYERSSESFEETYISFQKLSKPPEK